MNYAIINKRTGEIVDITPDMTKLSEMSVTGMYVIIGPARSIEAVEVFQISHEEYSARLKPAQIAEYFSETDYGNSNIFPTPPSGEIATVIFEG